jgi:hypothetical protein
VGFALIRVAVVAVVAAGLASAGSPSLSFSHCADVDAPSAFPRSTLVGDVDGDARRDRVTVLRRGAVGCPLLVVRGSRIGERSVEIHQHGLEQPWPDRSSPPYLVAIARIGKGKRAEPIVVTSRGASTYSLAVFGFLGERLVRYVVPHALPTDTFVVGGTALTTYGVDCFRKAEVIAGTADRAANGTYRIARTTYALRARVFRPVRHLRLTRRELPPNFGAQPFASCSRRR